MDVWRALVPKAVCEAIATQQWAAPNAERDEDGARHKGEDDIDAFLNGKAISFDDDDSDDEAAESEEDDEVRRLAGASTRTDTRAPRHWYDTSYQPS